MLKVKHHLKTFKFITHSSEKNQKMPPFSICRFSVLFFCVFFGKKPLEAMYYFPLLNNGRPRQNIFKIKVYKSNHSNMV